MFQKGSYYQTVPTTRYKRISQAELPPNIVMRRTYRQELRQEVADGDKEVVEYLILLKKLPKIL